MYIHLYIYIYIYVCFLFGTLVVHGAAYLRGVRARRAGGQVDAVAGHLDIITIIV